MNGGLVPNVVIYGTCSCRVGHEDEKCRYFSIFVYRRIVMLCSLLVPTECSEMERPSTWFSSDRSVLKLLP